MFTGLVETIGTITSLLPLDPTTGGGNGTSLTISQCPSILSDAKLGDSISVNGTCLTITELSPDLLTTSSSPSSPPSPTSHSHFKVGVAPETLRRTNLGRLSPGSKVNLERAVLGSTRMGGHFVQGHVDTVATIASVTPDGNALTFRLRPREAGVLRYVVEKGYITLDGASLTVTAVEDDDDDGQQHQQLQQEQQGWFEVMLIAYTQERVVMAGKTAGEEVNVEIDVVGKLVEKSVVGYFEDVLKKSRRQQETEAETETDGQGGVVERRPAIIEKMVGRIVDQKIREWENRTKDDATRASTNR